MQAQKERGRAEAKKTDLWKPHGISSGTPSHWFSGGASATLDNCERIAPTLRVSARWLFDGAGPMERDVFDLTPEEEILVIAYRKASPAMKEGARKMLDAVLPESKPIAKTAA